RCSGTAVRPTSLVDASVASTKRCKDAGRAHRSPMGAAEDAATRSVIAGEAPRCEVGWAAQLDTPEQRERPADQGHLPARGDHAVEIGIRGDLDLPARAETARRERGRHRLAVRVEEQQEGVVADLVTVGRARRYLLPVEEDAERVRILPLPVLLRHPPTVRAERPHVRQAGAEHLMTGEEPLPAEDRVMLAQLDQP